MDGNNFRALDSWPISGARPPRHGRAYQRSRQQQWRTAELDHRDWRGGKNQALVFGKRRRLGVRGLETGLAGLAIERWARRVKAYKRKISSFFAIWLGAGIFLGHSPQ